MRLTGDAATGASIIALGMFFLWGAELIDVYGDDAIPSDFFPRAISILLILAGAALAAGGVVAARRVTPTSQDWRDFGRVTLPLAALTVGYAVLWRQIGYLGASMIVAPLMFLVFGNRGWRDALLVPAVVVIVFFVLFFSLMGLHDAPGRLLNQGPLNRLLGA
jgi:hypothetical protein